MFLDRNLVTSFMLAELAETLLKSLGLDCGQVSVQTGTCPPWLVPGIVPPEDWLAWAAGLLLCCVALCWWCLQHCRI